MFKAALWEHHPVLRGLLGLTPVLAVTTRVIDAVLFGLVFLLSLLASSVIVALLRNWIAPATRLLAVLIISAAVVSIADILSRAWLYDWHAAVGIYLPLIATSTLLLAWLEEDAITKPLPEVISGAVGQGLALLWLLLALAVVRELLGHGSLLAGVGMLPELTLPATPLPLLKEPAGGLLLLGFVFAIYHHFRPEPVTDASAGQGS